MAKATYYSEILEGKVYDILATNKDGTVNIGTGDTVVVRSVPVVKEPKVGHVILGDKPSKPETADKTTEK
jgi:hypothetical protein